MEHHPQRRPASKHTGHRATFVQVPSRVHSDKGMIQGDTFDCVGDLVKCVLFDKTEYTIYLHLALIYYINIPIIF